jgi:hypothetical protein
MTTPRLLMLVLLTGAITFTLYTWRQKQPPDAAQIARCDALVKDLPEATQEEINRSINTFMECLEN